METTIQNRLWELQDLDYRDFAAKLTPSISIDTIIGVRTPELRKFAKELGKSSGENLGWREFIRKLPHDYYEENNLHGFLLEGIKDYDECVRELNRFLPYVDNWATCDMMNPKVLKKYPEKLILQIREWMDSPHTYTCRFGMEMLMRYFLEENFQPVYLDWIAEKRSEEYYINMMIAWFFATALAKQYEATLPILTEHRLSLWCHNKTIQKAIESYRITPEQKEYLRGLRRKTT